MNTEIGSGPTRLMRCGLDKSLASRARSLMPPAPPAPVSASSSSRARITAPAPLARSFGATLLRRSARRARSARRSRAAAAARAQAQARQQSRGHRKRPGAAAGYPRFQARMQELAGEQGDGRRACRPPAQAGGEDRRRARAPRAEPVTISRNSSPLLPSQILTDRSGLSPVCRPWAWRQRYGRGRSLRDQVASLGRPPDRTTLPRRIFLCNQTPSANRASLAFA
jgi:hypothetical protein